MGPNDRFIVFGLVVGAVARLLPGKQHLSIVATLIIGVLSSVVGGVIANALGTGDNRRASTCTADRSIPPCSARVLSNEGLGAPSG